MATRRTFLRRLGASAIALTLARKLPGIAGEPILVPPPPVEAATLRAGDTFTIEGVYQINPDGLAVLRQFVVTADVVPRQDGGWSVPVEEVS